MFSFIFVVISPLNHKINLFVVRVHYDIAFYPHVHFLFIILLNIFMDNVSHTRHNVCECPSLCNRYP